MRRTRYIVLLTFNVVAVGGFIVLLALDAIN